MTCDEAAIAIATGVWVIPGGRMGRMKMGVEHSEPLTERARDSQGAIRGSRTQPVCVSQRQGEEANRQKMRCCRSLQAHESRRHRARLPFDHEGLGWRQRPASRARSPSRHWRTPSAVSRATIVVPTRSRKRRDLMELWARYLEGDPGATVVAIGDRRADNGGIPRNHFGRRRFERLAAYYWYLASQIEDRRPCFLAGS